MQQLTFPRDRLRAAYLAGAALVIFSGCSALPARLATRSTDVRGSAAAMPLVPVAALATTDGIDLGNPRHADQAELFALVNGYRTHAGLGTLRYSKRLELAAETYARQMYRESFFDHRAPDGSMPPERAVAAGFSGSMVGENLAYGQNRLALATDAMLGLKHSPSHNANMLREDWQYAGIGHFTMTTPRGVEHWWVQLFGRD